MQLLRALPVQPAAGPGLEAYFALGVAVAGSHLEDVTGHFLGQAQNWGHSRNAPVVQNT